LSLPYYLLLRTKFIILYYICLGKKQVYLVKKDELIKIKIAPLEKKGDLGRKGNSWVGPLRSWIKDAHYAEKLASSNDFDEIKSFKLEQTTTCRTEN
jgi:hypothetical protein